MPKRSGPKLVYRCSKFVAPSSTVARYGASPAMRAALGGLTDEADIIVAAVESLERIWSDPPSRTRYSDGSYPVLYTAKSTRVAVTERSHWAVELAFKKMAKPPPIPGFAVIACRVKAGGKSLMRGWRLNKMLVHPSDYSLCNLVGKSEATAGTNFIIVPSARRLNGACVPVLQPNVISFEKLVSTFTLQWDTARREAFRDVRGRRYYITVDKVYDLV